MAKPHLKEIDLAQQIKFLRKIAFFSDFDDHELKQFLSVSKWLKVPRRTLIIKENTMERVFYILVRGEVSVFKTLPAGSTIELTTLRTGACFGEMALVTEAKRTAGVRTTTDSFLLMVNPEIISTSNVFLQLKFYKRFCEILVTRLDQTNKRMAGQKPEVVVPPKLQTAPKEDQAEGRPPEITPGQPAAIEPEEEEILPAALPPKPERKERSGLPSLKRQMQSEQCLIINPAVAAHLTSLVSGDCENTRNFADLLSLDPILSSKVLQVANSPFFRRTCAVLSVPHAMIIVGIKHIQKVVAETLEASPGTKPFSGFRPLGRAFWQHGVVVGRIAELLKEVIRLDMSTDVYLAGLLHDMGKLGLDLVEPRFYPQYLREAPGLGDMPLKAETDYVGAHHGQAGKWLGEYLGLPAIYQEIMALHHTPEKAGGEQALPVSLVHLADLFAKERGVGFPGQGIPLPPMDSPAWAVIRDHHRPFCEVDPLDFVAAFNDELTKNWQELTAGIPLQ